jgi:LuxR family maltose regulon positive regulatory protein
MAHMRPLVLDTTLRIPAEAGQPGVEIPVGTPAWYTWLAEAGSFAFRGAAGSFTARKERHGQTGWRWKAYRRQAGKLYTGYLGQSSDLTLDRLQAIAAGLARRGAGSVAATPSPPPAPPAPAAPILTTKLYLPRARPGIVPRPRLTARLTAGLAGKLTLISAPTGSGKTTLLSACIQAL